MNAHNKAILMSLIEEFQDFFKSMGDKEFGAGMQLIPVNAKQTVALIVLNENPQTEELDYTNGIQIFRRAINIVEEVVGRADLEREEMRKP